MIYFLVGIVLMQSVTILLIVLGMRETEALTAFLRRFEDYVHEAVEDYREKQREQVRKKREERQVMLEHPYREPPPGTHTLPNAIKPRDEIQLVVDDTGRTYINGQEFIEKDVYDRDVDALQRACDDLEENLKADLPPWEPGECCPYCRDGVPEPKGMSRNAKQRLMWSCDTCGGTWTSAPLLDLPADNVDMTERKDDAQKTTFAHLP